DYSERGVTVLLHRLGYVYKKPKLIPGKANAKAQQDFIEKYEQLKEEKQPDDEILFQACRYLVIDFGTSKSPKSTRQRDNHYCPGRPASVPLRHTFVNSALATQHSLK
ncbi:helix-turn-helix domain-containing protein, partial [Thiolapillus sp.]|uniref:helix-turn-helix domain-containing protein n=1 Tax=Thiolapillus sp. TaxID=2017437 RepID=UPI003AF506BE